MPMKVGWSGGTYPAAISTELFNTGNNSESDRVLLASQSLYGKTCTINIAPRTIDDHVEFADGQSPYWLAGTSENTWKPGIGDLDWPPYTIGSNSVASSEFMADGSLYRMKESDQDNNTQILHTRLGAENAVIEEIYFLGQGTQFNGAHSGIAINGGSNNHIRDCVFDGLNSYHAFIQYNAEDSTIDSCTSKNYLTQVQGFISGIRCLHKDAVVEMDDLGGPTVAFAALDYEPNDPTDIIRHIEIRNPIVRARRLQDPSSTIRMLMVQATNSHGVDGLLLTGGQMIANDLEDPPETSAVLGYSLEGVSNFEFRENEAQGIAFNSSLFVRQSANGKITANTFNGNITRIKFEAVANTFVEDNVLIEVANGYTQLSDIIEAGQQNHTLGGSTGSDVTCRFNVYGPQDGRAYNHYVGLNCLINNTTYEITVMNFAEPNMGFEIDSVVNDLFDPRFFPSTDVNATTNEIDYTSHGLITRAKVQYSPDTGSTSIGGLAQDSYYYAIASDADHIKLAETKALAIAGTAIDLTSAGTGDHFLFLVAETQFGANEYTNNTASAVTLEPGMGSIDHGSGGDAVEFLGDGLTFLTDNLTFTP
jgi:hypothetical protein